jgi:hypothetical protein
MDCHPYLHFRGLLLVFNRFRRLVDRMHLFHGGSSWDSSQQSLLGLEEHRIAITFLMSFRFSF